MFKVRLNKIRSNHNNLRTEEIFGQTDALPVEGKAFLMYGEALDPIVRAQGGFREIWTTEVKLIDRFSDTELEFHTINSTYRLTVLEEVHDAA